MSTIQELYPDTDFNNIVYEDKQFFLGKNDSVFYLKNKIDSTAIIVMDMKKESANILMLVFSDDVLVNTYRFKHLFITTSASSQQLIIDNERYQTYVEMMSHYYFNDCYLTLGPAINDQVNHYMKSVSLYKVYLNFLQEHGNQVLNTIEIEDNVYNFKYHAIVRDGLVYFTMMFNDDPEREEFVKDKFDLQAYNHYEAAGGYIIDSFIGSWFIAETHYDPYHQHYEFKSIRYTESAVVPNIDILKEHPEYDVNFIFNFIYDTVIIHHPNYSFTEKLIELSILTEGETLTHEHMELYDMAII